MSVTVNLFSVGRITRSTCLSKILTRLTSGYSQVGFRDFQTNARQSFSQLTENLVNIVIHKTQGKPIGRNDLNKYQIRSTVNMASVSNVREMCNENEHLTNVFVPQIIAVVQMTSTSDKTSNMKTCNRLIISAKEKGAKIVFLPECFDYIANNKIESANLAETLDGPLISNYQEKARTHKIWLSLGGFKEKQSKLKDDGQPYICNTHILIDDNGTVVSKYNKIHLFDLEHPVDGVFLRESDIILPGNLVMNPILTPLGPIGLGICYDMRFPEFALKLRLLGASILTYPSAFTVPTGQAHWEVLIRARAIESQCYVVCAAQVGKHNEKRESYGHSIVVDPWGKVIAEAKAEDELLLVEVDMNIVQQIRSKMPVISHRMPSVYQLHPQPSFSIPTLENNLEEFQFGQVSVKMDNVFLESFYSRAFVNRKCVLPGHVLVIPKIPTLRVSLLSTAQVSDLFLLVQKVELIMEELHGATSSFIGIQDGIDAGRSIDHVHVHVLPRKPLDFPSNDEIYEKLANHDKGENIQWRDPSDMLTEANRIKQHIYKNHQNILVHMPVPTS